MKHDEAKLSAVVELPTSAAIEEAPWYAAQHCPKRRERTADEPYAPKPERSMIVPASDEVEVDITDMIRRCILEDANQWSGENLTAERPEVLIVGGRIIVRYQMRATDEPTRSHPVSKGVEQAEAERGAAWPKTR